MLAPLTDIQREIVSMITKFAGLDKNRIRYSREWVCESFIMHTKSSALYEYMRDRGILPLPSPNTLKTHTAAIDKNYGFHDAVFESLKIKAADLGSRERRGKYIKFLMHMFH